MLSDTVSIQHKIVAHFDMYLIAPVWKLDNMKMWKCKAVQGWLSQTHHIVVDLNSSKRPKEGGIVSVLYRLLSLKKVFVEHAYPLSRMDECTEPLRTVK